MKTLVIIVCALMFTHLCAAAEEPKESLRVEYSVTGGFAGGTHYVFLVTDNDAATTGLVKLARKSDVYVIPKEAVSEFEALLAKRGVNKWKSPPQGNASDAFDTHFKVEGPKTHCDVVFTRMPTQGADLHKQVEALVKDLKALAGKQGRRIEAK